MEPAIPGQSKDDITNRRHLSAVGLAGLVVLFAHLANDGSARFTYLPPGSLTGWDNGMNTLAERDRGVPPGVVITSPVGKGDTGMILL